MNNQPGTADFVRSKGRGIVKLPELHPTAPETTNSQLDKGKQMTTALHIAAVSGQVEEVKRLLAEGTNPNVVDQEYDTPLHLAADTGQAEAVDILLQAGADPNAHCRDGDTPLHRSIGNIAIAEMLIQAGAQMLPDATGGIPLHFAANLNRASAILFLLQKGADIDKQDLDGDTPLHDALRRGSTLATLELLRNGADHLIENDRKMTPLELGHEAGQYHLIHLAMQEIETPLHHAAYRGELSSIQLLIQEKADPNARDDRGFPPLFYAVMAGHLTTTRFLLDNGANAHTVARFGANAVDVAVGSQQIETLEYLLTQGVSSNGVDRIRGGNALHNAARRGSPTAILLLTQHGVRVNATDFWGRTPLDYTRDYPRADHTVEQKDETVQALISAGGRYNPPMPDQRRWNEIQWLTSTQDLVSMLAPYRTITRP